MQRSLTKSGESAALSASQLFSENEEGSVDLIYFAGQGKTGSGVGTKFKDTEAETNSPQVFTVN